MICELKKVYVMPWLSSWIPEGDSSTLLRKHGLSNDSSYIRKVKRPIPEPKAGGKVVSFSAIVITHGPSASVVRPSVYIFCLHISIYKYQTISNKVEQYVYDYLRSRMSSIMGQNGPDQPEFPALELEKLLYLTSL